MRDYKVVEPLNPGPNRAIRNDIPPRKGNGPSRKVVDPVVQSHPGLSAPGELSQFEGLSDADVQDVIANRFVPPDVNGDVSQDQFVEYINTIWAVYDKSGTLLLGPLPGNSFWQGLGGVCETTDDGDPIVKYDRAANRWFVSQFSPIFPSGPSHQCMAVSTTSDATGSWFTYDFLVSNDHFADYPKFGIWPDAYYMTANMFGAAFSGGAFAFDRTKMLAGDPSAGMLSFSTAYNGSAESGVLPSDWNGPLSPPPAGAPNHFMTFELVPSPDACAGSCLLLWDFHADFETPGNSTFTGPKVLPVPAMNVPICGSFRDQCVPQLDSTELLETLSGNLMYPLPYRNFGDHEVIVASHTVGDGTGIAQVRWYEIRDPGGSPVLQQAATYAPDSSNRWMPSIAMDRQGNIALNYSRSDSTIHPQASMTGRLVGDPINTMGAEVDWFSGAGSQVNSASRWGDYTSIFLDPIDDCTFWAMNEYYATTTDFQFQTRVGSFKFAGCTDGPTGIIEGTVTDGTNPIQGAKVTAGASDTSTNAAGHYQLPLPVGDYDMTASKFTFVSASANAVPVTDGGDTVRDFVLTPAPLLLVNGVVKDSSGGGWPLYAKLVISAPGTGYPGATIYSDPVTGYYSITLFGGNTYHFVVTAVSPGYVPAVQDVPVGLALTNDPGGIIQNFGLAADVAACVAPGYTLSTAGLSEDFSSGSLPPGWTTVNDGDDGTTGWVIADGPGPGCSRPIGNLTGGTGPAAIINSDCDGFVTEDGQLKTPSVDMSSLSSATVRFNLDYRAYYNSTADVDISTDGGATWNNVFELTTTDERGPALEAIDITALAAGKPSVMARFHYTGFFAWWWQVDNVLLGQATCLANPGGLVVGNVRDGNTGSGLNGATVKNLPNDLSTTTFATPGDPNQDDGLYILFAGSGLQPFRASPAGYAPVDKSTVVVPNSTVRLDFSMAAGVLDASPRPMTSKVDPGATDTQTLTLTNTGTAPAHFVIGELSAAASAPASVRRFADPAKVAAALARIPKDYRVNTNSVSKFPPLPGAPMSATSLAGGNIINHYPASSEQYGVMFNTDADNYWISSIAAFAGDDKDHLFLTNGTDTGDTIDVSSVGLFAQDGAFNQSTGMLWQAFGNSSTIGCIYELNPATRALTGNTICPAFGAPQTGLAYDVVTNSYYSGSFFDGVVNHFDSSGTILDSAYLGLAISGLAFNPGTGHLFVLAQQIFGFGPADVFVYDVKNNYAFVGGFFVGGAPGLQAGNAGGMDMDCNGHLWLVNQLDGVYEVDSGEPGCSIPWVSEDPTSGTVAAGAGPNKPAAAFLVAVTFDSTGLRPGLRQGLLTFTTDTPSPVAPVPLNFTVRFLDVPDGSFAENFIYGAAGAGVMTGSPYPGCHPGVLNFFCPSGLVTRADMAGYIERAKHGALTPPPVYTGIFSDVLSNDYNANYIQGVFNDGITAGCQNPGQPLAFCPSLPISRGQMAVFIEKSIGNFAPPDCTQFFTDVPCPPTPAAPYGNFIQQLFLDGITAGCAPPTDPNYPKFCPDQNIPNDQMAVFLVKAFGLPVLP